MPSPSTFTFSEEQQILRELVNIKNRNDQFRQTATQSLAETLGDMIRMAPNIAHAAIVPIARAVESGVLPRDVADNLVMETQKKILQNPITYNFDKNPLERAWDWSFEKLKAGVKWTASGAMLTGDLLQTTGANLAAGAVSAYREAVDTASGAQGSIQSTFAPVAERYKPIEWSFDLSPITQPVEGWTTPDYSADLATWAKSTYLGAMLTGANSGNGWFVGEEAARIQRDAARQVRGTVNGSALTAGRGVADIFFEPRSLPYNLLSGLIDATVAIATPAAPGFPKVKGAIAKGLGEIEIPRALGLLPGATAEEIRPLLRTLAGLTDMNEPFIIGSKVSEFLDSTPGQYLQQLVANIDSYAEATRKFPNTPMSFRRAVVNATEKDVRQILQDSLGNINGLLNVNDIRLSRWSDLKNLMTSNNVSRIVGFERLMGKQAGREIALVTDDIWSATKSVDNLQNWMRNLRIAPEVSEPVVRELVETLLDNPGNFKNVSGKIMDIVVPAMAQQSKIFGKGKGVSEDVIRRMFASMEKNRDTYITFGYVENGEPVMFGFGDFRNGQMPGRGIDGVDGWYMLPDGLAMTASEMRRFSMIFPDPKRVYRMTSDWNWIFERGSLSRSTKLSPGDMRALWKGLDFVQNQVWKTMAVMTPAFVTRVLSEGLFRGSLAPGIKTGALHPIEFIATLISNDRFGKFLGDIDGFRFSEYAKYAEADMRNEFNKLVGNTSKMLDENISPEILEKKAAQTGAIHIAHRGQEGFYIQALQDNIHWLATDPIFQRAITDSNETIIKWLASPEGNSALKSLQARHANKRSFNMTTLQWENGVTIKYINDDGTINRFAVDKFLENTVRPRIRAVTLDIPELKQIIANGDRLGEFELNGETVQAFKTAIVNQYGDYAVLDYTDEFTDLMRTLVKDPAYKFPDGIKGRAHLEGAGTSLRANGLNDNAVKLFVRSFFQNAAGKSEQFFNRSPAWRQYYYYMIDKLLDELAPGESQKVVQNVRDAFSKHIQEELESIRKLRPDKDGLYDFGDIKVTKVERNAKIAELEDLLVIRDAEFTDKWAARWMGSADIWQRVVDKAEGRLPSNGKRTVEDISAVARTFALSETERTFYKAAQDSNIAEALRIIYPFGRAYAEFMKWAARTAAGGPENFKKTYRSIQGAINADPDNDGRGFIYTDPTTGVPMFNYLPPEYAIPILMGINFAVLGATAGSMLGFSAATSALAGGAFGVGVGAVESKTAKELGVQLSSPATALNPAFSNFLMPGFGPTVQIAASYWLRDKPQYDWIANMVIPYGTPSAASMTAISMFPPAIQKFVQAISQDPEQDRIYGSYKWDAFAYLLATGDYDTTNREDLRAAENKAGRYGAYLTALQALGQLAGPGRPSVRIEIPTKFRGKLTVDDVTYLIEDGNIPNNVLARAFRLLQQDDWSTAPATFIDLFGSNTIMSTIGKTQAATEGVSATKEFWDWYASNKDFAQTHEDIYALFAPVGTEFDKQAYFRLLQSGQFTKRTNLMVAYEDAETVVARSLYRKKRAELSQGAAGTSNPELTPFETEELKAFNIQLREMFPGYAAKPLVLNDIAIQIQRATAAAYDSRMDNNPAAMAARLYIEMRDEKVAEANSRRDTPATMNPLNGKKNFDLRYDLMVEGERLARLYPEFARLWDRVFFDELDQ